MIDYDQYKLDDCGLYHLSVIDAATLITADIFQTGIPFGSYEVDNLVNRLSDLEKDEVAEIAHRDFRKLKEFPYLADLILTLESALTASIASKELKAALVRKDFDGEIDGEKTILKVKRLEQWLTERSYEPGDGFQEFFEWENDIHGRVLSIIHWERFQLKEKIISEVKSIGTYDSNKLIEHLTEKLADLENEQKMFFSHFDTTVPKEEKIPSPKSRNSYLRTINALSKALIKGRTGKPHIDAQAILNAMQAASIDAPIDERTLANYLKDAEKLED